MSGRVDRLRGPALLIHGGTGAEPSRHRIAALRRSLHRIGTAAYHYLRAHSALESAIYAVSLLEDNPLFNAGTGSALQQDGRIRMSASVMDGSRVRFAAVLNVERVRHPILVATTLLAHEDRVLAGPPATRFARSFDHRPWDPTTPARVTQWRQRHAEAHGTVGAIALDPRGRLAAATSTGGRGFERPGRVSDSGLPVGNYANADVAISCTGVGEDIIDEGLAVRVAERFANGASLKRAIAGMLRTLTAHNRKAGFISLDRQGRWAWGTTLPILFAIAHTPSGRAESF